MIIMFVYARVCMSVYVCVCVQCVHVWRSLHMEANHFQGLTHYLRMTLLDVINFKRVNYERRLKVATSDLLHLGYRWYKLRHSTFRAPFFSNAGRLMYTLNALDNAICLVFIDYFWRYAGLNFSFLFFYVYFT